MRIRGLVDGYRELNKFAAMAPLGIASKEMTSRPHQYQAAFRTTLSAIDNIQLDASVEQNYSLLHSMRDEKRRIDAAMATDKSSSSGNCPSMRELDDFSQFKKDLFQRIHRVNRLHDISDTTKKQKPKRRTKPGLVQRDPPKKKRKPKDKTKTEYRTCSQLQLSTRISPVMKSISTPSATEVEQSSKSSRSSKDQRTSRRHQALKQAPRSSRNVPPEVRRRVLFFVFTDTHGLIISTFDS